MKYNKKDQDPGTISHWLMNVRLKSTFLKRLSVWKFWRVSSRALWKGMSLLWMLDTEALVRYHEWFFLDARWKQGGIIDRSRGCLWGKVRAPNVPFTFYLYFFVTRVFLYPRPTQEQKRITLLSTHPSLDKSEKERKYQWPQTVTFVLSSKEPLKKAKQNSFSNRMFPNKRLKKKVRAVLSKWVREWNGRHRLARTFIVPTLALKKE